MLWTWAEIPWASPLNGPRKSPLSFEIFPSLNFPFRAQIVFLVTLGFLLTLGFLMSLGFLASSGFLAKTGKFPKTIRKVKTGKLS